MTTSRVAAVWVFALLSAASQVVTAQDTRDDTAVSRRIAFDTVSGYQDFFIEDADWPAQFIVDAFVGVELAPGWQLSVRPVVWRIRGEWDTLLDQASCATRPGGAQTGGSRSACSLGPSVWG